MGAAYPILDVRVIARSTLPIRNGEDLRDALAEIGPLLNSEPGSAGEARLEVLSVLVRDYEATHHPIPPPDPVEAIRFRLKQRGLTTKALEAVIGSRARVSEVLNRKRRLSLAMIQNLHETLSIPLESLIGTPGEMARRRAR
jgi:HTH-type transcriptional regulator/antitoxin HigA